jgi:hypothetical protein
MKEGQTDPPGYIYKYITLGKAVMLYLCLLSKLTPIYYLIIRMAFKLVL